MSGHCPAWLLLLFSAVIGGIIMNRVLLISGLFSWNSGNTPGWNVFYASVVSIACFGDLHRAADYRFILKEC